MKSSKQAIGQVQAAPVAIAPIDSIRRDLIELEQGPQQLCLTVDMNPVLAQDLKTSALGGGSIGRRSDPFWQKNHPLSAGSKCITANDVRSGPVERPWTRHFPMAARSLIVEDAVMLVMI